MKHLIISVKSSSEVLKDFKRAFTKAKRGGSKSPHYEISFDNRRDFEKFVRQAAEDLKSGKPMIGCDGVFTLLLRRIIEALLEGELDAHLHHTRSEEKNKHNGRKRKNIQSPLGGFEIFSPRDRNSTFEPQLVQKR